MDASRAFVPLCPICEAEMVRMYDRHSRTLYACAGCDTDVIVPIKAWAIGQVKREQKSREKP